MRSRTTAVAKRSEFMNRLQDALAAYNRAIELNPRYARAYRQPGRYLAQARPS